MACAASSGRLALAANDGESLHAVIRSAQQRVVKIYGAGGLSGLEAYQSGILISDEGHVLTVLSYVLDTDDLAVVIDDGRKFPAELLGVDPVRELAVLKLPVEEGALPYFDLEKSPAAKAGERVIAASNLFNIASGDEPVSVLQGVVTAVTPLDARRGSHQTPFQGDVYIVDAAANNPGAAGGALVNWRGELLGVLGKELRSRASGAWLNYAIPIDQIVGSVEAMQAGRNIEDNQADLAVADPLTLGDVGIVLVPDILPRTPPYIDSIAADSAAERAGLRRDDLVVFIDGEPVASCSEAIERTNRRESFDDLRVSVLRGSEIIEATLNAEDNGAAPEAEDEASVEPPTEESGPLLEDTSDETSAESESADEE